VLLKKSFNWLQHFLFFLDRRNEIIFFLILSVLFLKILGKCKSNCLGILDEKGGREKNGKNKQRCFRFFFNLFLFFETVLISTDSLGQKVGLKTVVLKKK